MRQQSNRLRAIRSILINRTRSKGICAAKSKKKFSMRNQPLTRLARRGLLTPFEDRGSRLRTNHSGRKISKTLISSTFLLMVRGLILKSCAIDTLCLDCAVYNQNARDAVRKMRRVHSKLIGNAAFFALL